MTGFAFVFGKCIWSPPSAKAALALLLYFYGIGNDLPSTYEASIEQQLDV